MSLTLSGIRKTFGSFIALDDVDFAARRGEFHALLGENGAGKSSLMNIAAGFYAPDAGLIEKDGVPLALSGPADARAHRIGMVHQHFKLVRTFTVAENILLANPRGPYGAGLRSLTAEISREAARLGLDIDPGRRVDSLSVAEQQRVEILKVLLAGTDILILDEPTSVLTDGEAARLMATLRDLASGGTAIVLVTHKLAEAVDHADHVTVMRNGRTIASMAARSLSTAELTRLVIGTDLPRQKHAPSLPGLTRLTVSGLSIEGRDGRPGIDGVSFKVRSGEIYGLAGVSGNGQSELAEGLMGLLPASGGSIELQDRGQPLADLHDASGRMAIIPADRQVLGLAGSLSVTENYAVGGVRSGRYGGFAFTNRRAMRRDAAKAVAAFNVQGVRSLDQKAGLLSGGNAQKLVLARELSGGPAVILAHSPSRGLDVGAAVAVYEQLRRARDAGAAILLISDDLDEILGLADRIGVMTRGRIVAEFDAPASRDLIGGAMIHHA